MKIRVFTDLRFTENPSPTGVGKHIQNMVGGMSINPIFSVSVLIAKDQYESNGWESSNNRLAFLSENHFPFSWKRAELQWTLTGRPWADPWCGDADWVYCPKNDFIPVKKPKLAVTIHGAHELDPAMPRRNDLYSVANRLRRRLQYKRICERADAILTVSEFLKGQIVDWFRADPAKITIVGNGVDPCFYEVGARESSEPDAPYVLCVGGLNWLDGGDYALRVARELKRAGSPLRLLVAGHMHQEDWVEEAMTLGNVQLLGYVPAEGLAPLMRGALCLLYLTRYETFGMAAAEAMAAGCPVVTCRSTAVPEVVGNAGIYVNPEKPGEGADAILGLLRNNPERNRLVREGRERAELFRWEDCVRRLSRVFQGDGQ